MKTILYTDEMLKATIEGRKTQTRRVIRGNIIKVTNQNNLVKYCYIKNYARKEIKPKYKIGEIIGIKENFKIVAHGYYAENISGFYENGDLFTIKLTEDEVDKYACWKNQIGKKSKLFMFDSMIRYKIEIKNVRVERVQDINVIDIENEGVILPSFTSEDKAIKKWIDLWNDINAKRGYSWESNPYCFVYDFKLIKTI